MNECELSSPFRLLIRFLTGDLHELTFHSQFVESHQILKEVLRIDQLNKDDTEKMVNCLIFEDPSEIHNIVTHIAETIFAEKPLIIDLNLYKICNAIYVKKRIALCIYCDENGELYSVDLNDLRYNKKVSYLYVREEKSLGYYVKEENDPYFPRMKGVDNKDIRYIDLSSFSHYPKKIRSRSVVGDLLFDNVEKCIANHVPNFIPSFIGKFYRSNINVKSIFNLTKY